MLTVYIEDISVHDMKGYVGTVAYPGIFFRGVGGSTNSAEDRGQRARESGGSSPVVKGSTQFVNERTPYSD
jgi:hypothetical protein